MITLNLGTRRSPLALAQSTQIKNALEAAHKNLTIELVGMDTQADEVHQNRFSTEPLQTLDGKNFFVKELDDALLAGKTDFSVHSYKDLCLDRPAGLMIAAITKRANPRDIILFHPDIHTKLASGEDIVIGSSSPRRAENTPAFLQLALPARLGRRASHERAEHCPIGEQGGETGGIKIMMKPLRGNINTRIKKLEAGDYDAIILAFAGITRLGTDISHLPKMILPLDKCPTAPAQGALAIECRSNDVQTQQFLSVLNDIETSNQIAKEREVLKRYGGGCHQAFGATVVRVQNLECSDFLFVKGKSDNGKTLDLIEFKKPTYTKPIVAWDGSHYRSNNTITLPLNSTLQTLNSIFITHHRAATPEIVPQLKGKRIWTSGVISIQKLAAMGLWVEGCAENLGFQNIREMLAEPILQLPPRRDWTILTHADAVDDWAEGNVIATYKIIEPQGVPEGLEQATHIWWGSGSQFLRLKDHARNARHHACGAGKTTSLLIKHNIKPDIFPNVGTWRNLL